MAGPVSSSADGLSAAGLAAARRLFAVDERAAAFGLYVGQKATDAVALVPELATADADPAADGTALTVLCDWCRRFSPAVAMDPPDGLFLDITGADHLWGGERPMMDDLVGRLAVNGLFARAAIAGTPGAAWAAAHFGACATIIAPDAEAESLAPLPIHALRLEAATAAQVMRLGLTTVGRLASLPRDQITRRFGPAVVLRLDQALGRAREALTFRHPPNPWFARLVFAAPISTSEDLARVARDIALELSGRLEAEGKGARRFDLVFHRLDGRSQSLAIGLCLPGRDAVAITRLFLPLLERVDPGFGGETVTLAAEDVESIIQRQAAFDGSRTTAVQETVAPFIDRLTNRLGEDAVWRAEAWPSHVPERAVARRPALSPPRGTGWDPGRPRPLRLFRDPQAIEAVAPVPDDPPIFFRWRGRPHRVRRAEGPERLAEEWWRHPFEAADPARARDYYRVEDEDGARFWLFRAGLYGADAHPKWWLHGLFG